MTKRVVGPSGSFMLRVREVPVPRCSKATNKNIVYFTWLTFSNTFENMHSHKHRRLHAPSLFIPQRGKSSHMSPSTAGLGII